MLRPVVFAGRSRPRSLLPPVNQLSRELRSAATPPHDSSGKSLLQGRGPLFPQGGRPGWAGASLDLFAIDGSGRPSRLDGSPLSHHSRTGALAVDRRNLYVGVPASQDRPAEMQEYRLPN
jgi:hypothetical protein